MIDVNHILENGELEIYQFDSNTCKIESLINTYCLVTKQISKIHCSHFIEHCKQLIFKGKHGYVLGNCWVKY